MEIMIGDVPWGVGHRSEKFRLVSLNDSYVGLGSTYTGSNYVFQVAVVTNRSMLRNYSLTYTDS
jgi:hypothetical protein